MNDSPHPASNSAGIPIPLRTLYELLRAERHQLSVMALCVQS
ncbi:hypothetical protein [Actinomyces naeslundii]|nr:hypothetical protein [Actinomyces naeslundii]